MQMNGLIYGYALKENEISQLHFAKLSAHVVTFFEYVVDLLEL